MNLIFEYSFDGGGNQGFGHVFNGIYNNITKHYPEVTKSQVSVYDVYPGCQSPGGRCGISSLKIINPDNKKATVLSFWDRAMDITTGHLEWDSLNIVHLIGGLGIYESPEAILKRTGIKFSPFLYALEFLRSYDFIEKYRTPYNYNEKIKKACFVGWIYDSRKQITDILEQHPLFDIFGHEHNLRGEKYYETLSQYALALSLNGNGEWCLRDVEAMGLGIPLVRAELKTPFYKELIPGVNYIKGNEASINASLVFPGIPFEQSAANYIKSVEDTINNEELLTSISRNNIEYYQQYLLLDKIIESFFDIFDLELLK
jgi:hypothetical protein